MIPDPDSSIDATRGLTVDGRHGTLDPHAARRIASRRLRVQGESLFINAVDTFRAIIRRGELTADDLRDAVAMAEQSQEKPDPFDCQLSDELGLDDSTGLQVRTKFERAIKH